MASLFKTENTLPVAKCAIPRNALSETGSNLFAKLAFILCENIVWHFRARLVNLNMEPSKGPFRFDKPGN